MIKLTFGDNMLTTRWIFITLTLTLSLFNSKLSQAMSNNEVTPLRIAVASNFTPVLKTLLVDFEKQTNIPTQVISGASGAMFLQIKHGAPFDIFLSADSQRPTQLENLGYGLTGSRKTYAIGQLALYSATAKSLTDLNQIPNRFAVANPKIAPYGKAAQQALEHLGLWQDYQPTLILGINIGQTFTQVRSKAVTAGLVANSQLIQNKLSGIVIPSNYHEPIAQQLVIISASKKQHEAALLSQFLLSVESQHKIVNAGYGENTNLLIDNTTKNNSLEAKPNSKQKHTSTSLNDYAPSKGFND